MMGLYNKAVEKFDKKIWNYLVKNFDLDELKVIAIAGPGFPKIRFLDKLKNIT